MAENIITSPSRDKNGNLTTPGATFVGDLGSIVSHAVMQLVIQAEAEGKPLTLDEAKAQARLEVFAKGVSSAAEQIEEPTVAAPAPAEETAAE